MGQYAHMCEWRAINMSAVQGHSPFFCGEFSERLQKYAQISHETVFLTGETKLEWPLCHKTSHRHLLCWLCDFGTLSFQLLEHLFAISWFMVAFKICIEWHRQGIRTPRIPFLPNHLETGLVRVQQCQIPVYTKPVLHHSSDLLSYYHLLLWSPFCFMRLRSHKMWCKAIVWCSG